MALKDFINSNLKGGVKDSLGGTFGRVFTGLGVLQIAQSNAKLKDTIKLLRDIALFRIAWPFQMLAIFKGIQGVIKGIVRDTGSLDAALRRLVFVKQLEAQFLMIKRSAADARNHIAALFQFSNRSPFNIEKVANASRTFELMGRGVYTSSEALEVFGDVASSTGNDIERVSSVASTFFNEVLGGDDISQTVEEMRQLGIITADTARRFQTMQRDGASASAMIAEMKIELGRSSGGMRQHANDVAVVADQYEKAKENMKAGFGESFVDKEKESMKAMTAIMIALTPPLQIIGKHLADIAGAFNSVTTRLLAWLSGLTGAQPVLRTVANGIGSVIKGLTALFALMTARAFLGLFQFTNAPGFQKFEAWIGKQTAKVTNLGKSLANALGAGSVGNFGANMSDRGDRMMRFGRNGTPVGAPMIGPLTAKDAAQQTANMANNLSMVRARAFAAGIAMKALGAATQFASYAMKALAAATIWMLVLQAIVAVVTHLGDAIKYWTGGMTEGQQAAKSMREETDKLTAALQNQINAIQTAEDRLAALAKVNEDLAEAEKALNDLKNKGSALGDATLGMIGEERASLAELAVAEERVNAIKKKRQAALQAPVEESQAARDLRTADARRARMERESAFNARMNYYGTAGQLLTRANETKKVQGEVDQGKALLTERKRMTEEQDTLNLKIKALEGKRDAGKAAGVDSTAVDKLSGSIADLKGRSTQLKRGSSSASISAEGEIEAIQAAITAANLQSGGGDQNQIKEALARAGGHAGQDKTSLMKQLDEERSKLDRAREIEDNFKGNETKLAGLKQDQVAQILAGDNPVVSSLARIGLGGNTGESDMLSIARQHKDLTAQILAVLEKQQGIEEPGKGDTDLFGSY